MKLWKLLAPVAICLVLVLLLVPTEANAATSGKYTYSVSGGAAIILDCDTSISGNVTIPSTLGGYPVTAIGDEAFYDCNSLNSVTIPNSVITIGGSAFRSCEYLRTVAIGNSVTTIGDGAFRDCPNLASVTIPYGVTKIGNYAFSSCTSLTGITIPDSVTTIGDEAFNYCRLLASVTIGNSVTTIGESAFYRCTSLTSVTIPDSVTTIESYAFSSCDSLDSVMMGNGVKYVWSSAFSSCGSLDRVDISDMAAWCEIRFSNEGANPLSQYWAKLYLNGTTVTDLVVPESVTYINNYTFAGYRSLTSVKLGKSVTTIGDNAFYCCNKLPSLTIPDSVKSIGGYAFYGCRSLTDVTIGNGVTTISGFAFSECESLTDVWYTGSKAERSSMSIGSDNNMLTSATWHYNSCWGRAEHTYDNTCDVGCNVCGKTRTITHAFDDACDTDCNVCGETRTISHDYRWIVDLAETCGTDGCKHEECAVCHDKRNENTVIPATNDHSYEDACDTDCDVCGLTRTPPHAFSAEPKYDETVHWWECTLCQQKKDQQDHSSDGNGGCTDCAWRVWVLGDIDGNGEPDSDDAIYLLLHIMFGNEDFPVLSGIKLDLDNNGILDTDDAIYLLLHVMFGEAHYPLDI